MMKKINTDNSIELTPGLEDDNAGRDLRNEMFHYLQFDGRLEAIERQLNQLSHTITSLEDSLTHITRIPEYPLSLKYDHATNTLWAQDRRKLNFTKKEALIISLMFAKSTGKPKTKIFQCGEVFDDFKKDRVGIETPKAVAQTAKRIQKKLDDFLNSNELMKVTTKSFYFTDLALK